MMERLTERHYVKEHGYYMKCTEYCYREDSECGDCQKLDELVDRLAAYEDTGLTPEEVTAAKMALMGKSVAEIKEFDGLTINRLRELAKADKDGRLVVLPCKVGDTVFIVADGVRRIYECEAKYFIFSRMCGSVIVVNKATGTNYGVTPAAFGEIAFLTRKEAEQALKEAKDDSEVH